jgi:hypothetical protein
MTTPVLKCPVCGSTQITPFTSSCAGVEWAQLRYRTPGGGILDQGIRLAFGGRACLNCGYVLHFLSAEALERARREPQLPMWEF